MTEVTLEAREAAVRVAENNLTRLAQRWLEARARGDKRKWRRLEREVNEAENECKRTARQLAETRKRLARK